MAADGAGPDWTAVTQAIAAVVQAIAAGAALLASYRLAKQSHRDAIERDRMAVQRAENDRKQAERIALEHWIGLLKRSLEVLRDAQDKCKDQQEGSAYFRSAKTNLQVIADLMERRAMDSLVEYSVLKFVTSGVAAVHGVISHMEELVKRVDDHPQSYKHFLAHVGAIPAQIEVCVDELKKRLQ